MNCNEVQSLLAAYADGELDLVRSVAIETHLSDCGLCSEQLQNLKSLHTAISSADLYQRAPTALRERLEQTFEVEKPMPVNSTSPVIESGPKRFKWTDYPIAATVLLALGIGTIFGHFITRGGSNESLLAANVVANHVRSLQVGHLMDVESSDRHTVKPWFLGKIDFSPQVPDLAAEGFPLVGGRLDYLNDRAVVALVYHHDKHTINLFIWPSDRGAELAVQSESRQGFHLRHWQHAGMTYWAISDLNEQEIDQFVREYQKAAGE